MSLSLARDNNHFCLLGHPLNSTALYACPICQSPLQRQGTTFQCEQNHSFDCHKKGYVNLLMSHHKNSKAPGDNTDMVKGRREFLRAGHYQAFANAIIALLSSCRAAPDASFSVLDAGCGEGYYTEQIQDTYQSEHIYGLDISKPAINAAATNKAIHWSVASSHRPPYIEHSFDAIVSIFSRIEIDAFLRMLKPEGYILYAGPGDNHLESLRSIIYDQVNDYSTDKHHDYFDNNFQLVKEVSLQVPLQLNSLETIKQLLSMTPHSHRISPNGYKRLEATTNLCDIGDFKLYLYQKNRAI